MSRGMEATGAETGLKRLEQITYVPRIAADEQLLAHEHGAPISLSELNCPDRWFGQCVGVGFFLCAVALKGWPVLESGALVL